MLGGSEIIIKQIIRFIEEGKELSNSIRRFVEEIKRVEHQLPSWEHILNFLS